MIYGINNNKWRFIRKGRASKTNEPSLCCCCCFSCSLHFTLLFAVFYRIVQTETRAISEMAHYESVLESNGVHEKGIGKTVFLT